MQYSTNTHYAYNVSLICWPNNRIFKFKLHRVNNNIYGDIFTRHFMSRKVFYL